MSTIHLTTHLENLSDTLALYDRIQYWRSTTGTAGTYFEITSENGGAAVLLGTNESPFVLDGTTLSISLSGADPFTVAFSGTDPTTIEVVVAKINAAAPSLIASPYLYDSRYLLLTNPLKGTQSQIVVSGTAASPLGLSTVAISGTAPRTLLGNLNTAYHFADYNGDPSYFYKTRFSNSLTGAASPFSAPQAGEPAQVLTAGTLVTCSVNLATITGAPVIGRRIILVAASLQQVLSGGVNYGLLPSGNRIELTTDESGHAQTQLAIGATVRAFFEGSGYSREFIVPNADFDLLTVISTQPDPFTIVVSPPLPIRES